MWKHRVCDADVLGTFEHVDLDFRRGKDGPERA